jgi:hypothetical protein
VNISNQVAEAIVGYLQDEVIVHDPTIIPGMSKDLSDERSSRIVIIGTDAMLRKPSLPGLYDVNGTVNVIQSVDDTDGDIKFEAMCAEVESILGARATTKAAIMSQDADLFIYSYIWLGSNLAASARKFMATYNFTVFARNSTNTIT